MIVNLTSCHVEFFIQCYVIRKRQYCYNVIYIVPSLCDEQNILQYPRRISLSLFIPAQPLQQYNMQQYNICVQEINQTH